MISYPEVKNNNYGYFSQPHTVIMHFFEKQGIFYAKIPFVSVLLMLADFNIFTFTGHFQMGMEELIPLDKTYW